MNIMIVDHEVEFAADLAYRLSLLTQGAGRVLRAQSLGEACKILTNPKTPAIDMLFLEEHLPSERSTDALCCLKSFRRLQNTKCVLMTRALSDPLRAYALNLGFDALVAKPISHLRLEKFVQQGNICWDIGDLPRNMDIYWTLHARQLGKANLRPR